MTILIIGAAGQLGSDLSSMLANHQLLTPSHAQLDVSDQQALTRYFRDHNPRIVFNLSAFHHVPGCEQDPLLAYRVNAVGVLNLARLCATSGSRLVTISTDYVFCGSKGSPYLESDTTAPLMTYGITKLAGECHALATCPQTIVVRTASLFGHHQCRAKAGGGNFIETILNRVNQGLPLEVVADITSSPTYTAHLAAQLKHLVANDAPGGLYHAVNSGGCSWYDFAKSILARKGIDYPIRPVRETRFNTQFQRPADSRLKNDRLNQLGLNIMPTLEEALTQYLD